MYVNGYSLVNDTMHSSLEDSEEEDMQNKRHTPEMRINHHKRDADGSRNLRKSLMSLNALSPKSKVDLDL